MNNSASERRDHDHDEVDPTGVRALLSSLPDPGPMPAALVARITASLQAEQLHRSTTDAAAPDQARVASGRPNDDHTNQHHTNEHHTNHQWGDQAPHEGEGPREHPPGVVDLGAERARRRPAWTTALLAGAAAIAVGAVVITSGVLPNRDQVTVAGDSAALEDTGDADPELADQEVGAPAQAPGPASEERADDADGGDSLLDEEAEPDPGVAREPSTGEFPPEAEATLGAQDVGGPTVRVNVGVLELNSVEYIEQIETWFAQSLDPVDSDEAAAAAADAPDVIGAYACAAQALVTRPNSDVVVSLARWDGRDVVLVTELATDPVLVWVMPSECLTGTGEPLLGPLEFGRAG